MSQNSAIEWTEATWNPVRGCTKISPGCAHCYAETFAERFRGVEGHPYEQGFDLRLVPDKLDAPLHWKKPRLIFVNSMSDIFHEDVPDEFIDKVFAVMAFCPQHVFQVLTKRAERMRLYLDGHDGVRWMRAGREYDRGDVETLFENPLDNVWLGVSVENKQHGIPRIEHLLRTPAAVRFLSVEPLLEDVGDISPYLESDLDRYSRDDRFGIPKDANTAKLDWVIVGGESGHGARPCDIEWIRSIIAQCQEASVPVFVKQLGGNVVWNGVQGGYLDGVPNVWPNKANDEQVSIDGDFKWRVRLKDKKGGNMAEWPEDLRIRELPTKATVPE